MNAEPRAWRRLGSAIAHSLLDPWLKASDPRALAVVRLILFWFMWPGFRPAGASGYAEFKGLTFHGVGLLGALHVPLLSLPVLNVLAYFNSALSGLALIGFLYPISAPASAAVNLYMNWIVQSSGKTNHGGLLFTLVIFVIAFSRAADAWSVDALIRHLRGKPRPRASAAYSWPARFISLMVATQYGAAGLSKLKRSGLEWGLGGSLRWRLLSHQFTHHPPTRIGVWLAGYPGLCRVLGTASLLLEVSSPLSQLHRFAYRIILPSLALLQFCIWLMMGVLFKEMIAIFACLLPWHEIIGYLDGVAGKLRVRLKLPVANRVAPRDAAPP